MPSALPNSYTSVDQVLAAAPEVGSHTKVNSALISIHIGNTEAQINARIAESYTIDSAVLGAPALQSIATDLSLYSLFSGVTALAKGLQDDNHPLLARYKMSSKLLDKIVDGDAPLLSGSATVLGAAGNEGATILSNSDGLPNMHEEIAWESQPRANRQLPVYRTTSNGTVSGTGAISTSISGLTSANIALDDELPFADQNAGLQERKTQVNSAIAALGIVANVASFTAVNSIATGDIFALYSPTSGAYFSATFAKFPSGGGAGGDAWSDPVDAVITPDADGTRDLGLTGTRFATGYFDNLDVTTNITVGGTVDGRDIATDGTKLDGIETGATADQSAAEILTAIKTVDGTGSGLDADTLDGTELAALPTLASLASTANGAGASLIGIEDAGTLITATTVEGALAENRAAIDAIEAAGYITDVTGDNFSALADVTITSIASGEIPKWNGSAWINNTLAEAGIAAASHTHVIADVTDFTDNSSNWDTAFGWGDHSGQGYLTTVAIDDVSDITITTPATGELLMKSAGDWVNATLAEAGIDPAGTDNSTDVTLAGAYDYLTLSGQEITLGQIDLTTDVTGVLPVANYATGTPTGSKFVRDDGVLAVPGGSGDVAKVGTPVDNQVGVWTGDGTIEGDANFTWDGTQLVFGTGKKIGTGTSATNTLALSAYDVDGAAYTDFLTLTAGNTPTADLSTSVTMGTNTIWHAGNDGSGSGLDADTLDGTEAAAFALLSTLASTVNGDGASLIGIEDAGTLITATTVEGALAENRAAIDALEAAGHITASSSDTLTNKTIDADNNTISNLAHGAEVDDPSSGVHGVSGSVVGTTDTQTLTNKTITTPTLTLPDANGAAPTTDGEIKFDRTGENLEVGDGTGTKSFSHDTGTATLQNKTIDSANNTLTLDLSEGTLTGTTAEFNSALSDGSFTTLAGTETLTNKTLTTPTLTLPDANGAAPTTDGEIKFDRTGENLEVGDGVGTKSFSHDTGTATLQNKTIDSANNTLTVDLSEATVTGTTAEFNTALSDGSFTTLAGTETLTNKTLTSPVLTTPQINDTSADHQYIFAVSELTADRTVTLPLLAGDDTFTFNAFAATLTNKTIDGDNNTISNLDLGNEVDWAAIGDVSDASAFASGDKVLIFEAGVGMRKVDYDDLPGGSGDAWSDAVDANIVPDADGTRDLGSATNAFANGYFDNLRGSTGTQWNLQYGTGTIAQVGNGQFKLFATLSLFFDNTNDAGSTSNAFRSIYSYSNFLKEQAAAKTDTAGFGQFWVENLTPNVPKFTDDAGTDFDIATSSGTTGGSSSAGAGNQYIEISVGGTTYKVLHDGTV